MNARKRQPPCFVGKVPGRLGLSGDGQNQIDDVLMWAVAGLGGLNVVSKEKEFFEEMDGMGMMEGIGKRIA